MNRYAVRLSYKGTNYHGWQIQNNANTVQGELENAFSVLLKKKTAITGCGRTDTGVHAINYYAYLNCLKEDIGEELEAFVTKLNGFLPKDIAIHEITEVETNWHARFDALSRTYEYKVHCDKNPFLEHLSLFLSKEPDFDIMNDACNYLIGTKDFECFSKTKTEVNNFICTITEAKWVKTETGYSFFVTANRFLRNMVRAIVGTMVELGYGKRTLEDVEAVIESKSRSEAGYSVPAHGLYLKEIKYKEFGG